MSPDGSRGLVGGPHRIFSEIHKYFQGSHLSMSTYLTNIVNTYKNVFKMSMDMPLLGVKEIELNRSNDLLDEHTTKSEAFANKRPLKTLKKESAGTEISYKCARCRGCSDCKNSQKIECISIQEEIEQIIRDRSVTVEVTQPEN